MPFVDLNEVLGNGGGNTSPSSIEKVKAGVRNEGTTVSLDEVLGRPVASPAPAPVNIQKPESPSLPWVDGKIDEEVVQNTITSPLASVMSGLYKSSAAIAKPLATGAELLEKTTGLKSGGLFREIEKSAEESAKYWEEKAKAPPLIKAIYEGVGSAPAGISEFMLGVPYAGMKGSLDSLQRSLDSGDYSNSSYVKAVKDGAIASLNRYGIGKTFEAIQAIPLTQVQRSGIMGAIFGTQSVAEQKAAGMEVDPVEVTASVINGIALSMGGPSGEKAEIFKNLVKEGTPAEIARDLAMKDNPPLREAFDVATGFSGKVDTEISSSSIAKDLEIVKSITKPEKEEQLSFDLSEKPPAVIKNRQGGMVLSDITKKVIVEDIDGMYSAETGFDPAKVALRNAAIERFKNRYGYYPDIISSSSHRQGSLLLEDIKLIQEEYAENGVIGRVAGVTPDFGGDTPTPNKKGIVATRENEITAWENQFGKAFGVEIAAVLDDRTDLGKWNKKQVITTGGFAEEHVLSLEKLLGLREPPTVNELVRNIETFDPALKEHGEHVATVALKMADILGVPENIKQDLQYGAWLHDFGKIKVRPELLNAKEGDLTPEGFKEIQQHVERAFEREGDSELSDTIRNIVTNHHEKFDGTGYPKGLSGSEIPIEAQIVSAADVYDALTSNKRSYRKQASQEELVKTFEEMRNHNFDPKVLDALFESVGLEKKNFPKDSEVRVSYEVRNKLAESLLEVKEETLSPAEANVLGKLNGFVKNERGSFSWEGLKEREIKPLELIQNERGSFSTAPIEDKKGRKIVDGGRPLDYNLMQKLMKTLPEGGHRIVYAIKNTIDGMAGDIDLSVRTATLIQEIADKKIYDLDIRSPEFTTWNNILKDAKRYTINPEDIKIILPELEKVSKKSASELSDFDGLINQIPAADVITEVMRSVDYKDVAKVNAELEKIGISTSERIAYHGSPVAESIKGHSAEATRSGLYNDAGEYAKYFTHDPKITEGYSGVESQFGWKPHRKVDIEDKLITGLEKKGFSEKAIANSVKMYNESVTWGTPLTPDLEAMFRSVGIDVAELTMNKNPITHKSLLSIKKTYNMEGEVHPEVYNLIYDKLGKIVASDILSSKNPARKAWKILGKVNGDNNLKQLQEKVNSLLSKYNVQTSDFTVKGRLNDLAKQAPPEARSLVKDLLLQLDRIEADAGKTGVDKAASNQALRDLGFDSITHLGHEDGYVTIVLKEGVEKPFFESVNPLDILNNERGSFSTSPLGQRKMEKAEASDRLAAEFLKLDKAAKLEKLSLEEFLTKKSTLTPEQIKDFITEGNQLVKGDRALARSLGREVGLIKSALGMTTPEVQLLSKELTGIDKFKDLSFEDRKLVKETMLFLYKSKFGEDYKAPKKTTLRQATKEANTAFVENSLSKRGFFGAKEIIERTTMDGEQYLRTHGPSAKLLADKLSNVRILSDLRFSDIYATKKQLSAKMTDKEKERVVEILETTPTSKIGNLADSQKIKDLVIFTREAFNDISFDMEMNNVKITDIKGKRNLHIHDQENPYWPRYYNADELLRPGRRHDLAVKHMISKGYADTVGQAETRLNTILSRRMNSPKYGNMEYAREFDVDGYERNFDIVFDNYFQASTKRLEVIKEFGQQGKGALEILGNIKRESGDYVFKYAMDIQNRVVGGAHNFDPVARAISDIAISYEVLTKMGRAGIRNLGQSANTIGTSYTKSSMRALKNIFSDPKTAMDRAQRAAAMLHSYANEFARFENGEDVSIGVLKVAEKAQDAASFALSASGFKHSEIFNRLFAAETGREFATDLFREYRDSLPRSRTRNLSKMRLEKLGLKPEEIINERNELNEFDRRTAAYNFVRSTQFVNDAMSLPRWVTSESPWIRFLTLFKTFGAQQGKLVYRTIKSDPSMAGKLLSVMTIMGGLTAEAIDVITQKVRDDEELIWKIARYFRSGGGFGLFADTVENSFRESNGLAEALSGVVIGDVGTKAFALKAGVIDGNWEEFKKTMTKDIPLIGPTVYNTMDNNNIKLY